MTDVLIKKGRDMHTGRTLCGDEGRDQDKASTTIRLPTDNDELGERHGIDSPPRSPKESPCQHLDLSLLASRTEMVHFCCSKPSSLGSSVPAALGK